MEEVAGEFAGKVKFVKMDIEEAVDVAVGCKVLEVPTLLFFERGHVVDKILGRTSKPALKKRVEAFLAAG